MRREYWKHEFNEERLKKEDFIGCVSIEIYVPSVQKAALSVAAEINNASGLFQRFHKNTIREIYGRFADADRVQIIIKDQTEVEAGRAI